MNSWRNQIKFELSNQTFSLTITPPPNWPSCLMFPHCWPQCASISFLILPAVSIYWFKLLNNFIFLLVMEVFWRVAPVFVFFPIALKNCTTRLLSVNLMCQAQLNFCFWFFKIISFSLLPNYFALDLLMLWYSQHGCFPSPLCHN